MYVHYLGAILIFGITPNFVHFLGATKIFFHTALNSVHYLGAINLPTAGNISPSL